MKFIYIILALTSNIIYSQVGINTESPLTSLHVAATDYNNPSTTDGVIIPIVKNLNLTSPNKPIGLLVFLDYEDSETDEIEKGFYWWNGIEWIPFFSMNKITADQTVTYVSSLNYFTEGNLTHTSDNIRTILFDSSSLKTNKTEEYEVNSTGLVVKKPGIYHIESTISLNSFTDSDPQARDAFEAKILVNNTEPTPNLRTAYGFPNGQTTFNSNSVISGYVRLNANDIISIQINRYYRDIGTKVTIKPNGAMTNLTLRYMGNN